jgi:MFS family permease
MSAARDGTELPTRHAAAGGAYAWYVLGVLFLVYVLNFVDRQILAILAQDIKAGLGLDDAQMGFLYGTAFAVFYSVFGIPLGRLADGWYRGRLIALGLALWSGMTVLSGLSSSYAQLAAARIGVGIGEASASPAAYSLLGDYFPGERRATALAIYTAGLYTGAGLSLPIGGSVAHAWTVHFASGGAPFGLAGWQAAFLAVGLPGLLLAAWVLTLVEPPRGLADGNPSPAHRRGAWGDFGREIAAILPPLTLWSLSRIPGGLRRNLVLLAACSAAALLLALATGDLLQWTALGTGAYAIGSWVQRLRATDRPTHSLLWSTPAVLMGLLSCGSLAFLAYGMSFWMPAYAMRTFHVAGDVAGWMIGIPSSFAAAAGCILGGRLSDRWRRRDPRGRVFVCMLSIALGPPIAYTVLSVADVRLACILYSLWSCVSSLWIGSGAAMIQEAVLPRMRGTAGATFLLGVSIIGLALGPYVAGRVSVLSGSLHTGMLCILAAAPPALYLMWRLSISMPLAVATKEQRARSAGEPLAERDGNR